MLKQAAQKHLASTQSKLSAGSPQNGDIRMQMKRPATPAWGKESGMGATPGTASNPLGLIPVNAAKQPGSRFFSAVSQSKMSALYSQTDDPFHDVLRTPPPPPLDLVYDSDDFNDTIDLDDHDLEIKRPEPLPQHVPTRPVQSLSNKAVSGEPLASSQISWPDSSPSHLTHTARAEPLKRQSSGEQQPQQPWKRVRRDLPPTYHLVPQTTADKKGHRDMELSSSAYLERKKELRARLSKKDAEVEDEAVASKEHLVEITRSNMVKGFAITLSAEQERVLDMVVNHGQSVFFTGPAGTGKSVLMRAIIDELRKKYSRELDRVAVTASTGLAACNIGGITLHSFAGIGLGKEDVPTLVKKIRRNPTARTRWLKVKCLIIDEVSMVDGDLFDKLSQIGRQIRNNGRPWGGIQLIITGDFFQLPPVPEGGSREVKFAFDAATWNTSINHTIGLTQVFRQKDSGFADMLNEMRLGRIDGETTRAFRALERPLPTTDGIEATELFPTRQEVENANGQKLRALPGDLVQFAASDTGQKEIKDRLLANMMAPKSLVLKKGAQVMLIKNIDDSLVNGTTGTVVDFKSRLETADDGNSSDTEAMSAAKRAIRKFTNQEGGGSSERYPLVEFHCSRGVKQLVLCEPHDWKVELPNGQVQAARKQVPLILAWALSIHKAQGQTLSKVRVNLSKVFEKGQAYVALSRATSQEGLQVLGFHPAKVMAHSRVVDFYSRLYTVDQVQGHMSVKPADALADSASKGKPPLAAVFTAAMKQTPAPAEKSAGSSATTRKQPAASRIISFDSDDEEAASTSFDYY